MPKKIRTWEDNLKSLSSRRKKQNPMQKIAGMKKEHLIQNHDELLKQVRQDLDTLANKKFFDEPVDQQYRALPPGFISQPPFPIPSEKMPEPGTQEYEDMISFMRADLACGMGYSRVIEQVREIMKKDGKDFEVEFKKWKEKKDAIQIS